MKLPSGHLERWNSSFILDGMILFQSLTILLKDILLYFSKGHHWIQDELHSQVQFLLRDGSAAVQSRGKRILKKLKSPSYYV
jgi:hypothetical protein